MLKKAYVVSGLPASGKSTVGRVLATDLGLCFLDKDEFLEALFAKRGVGDLAWRQRLSRESDALFEAAARAGDSAVLVSHWRPDRGQTSSGTPTTWLSDAYSDVVEIYCVCSASDALRRFLARTRHAGHCDALRDRDTLDRWMRDYGRRLPLGLGRVINVDTTHEPDIRTLVRQLRDA